MDKSSKKLTYKDVLKEFILVNYFYHKAIVNGLWKDPFSINMPNQK